MFRVEGVTSEIMAIEYNGNRRGLHIELKTGTLNSKFHQKHRLLLLLHLLILFLVYESIVFVGT